MLITTVRRVLLFGSPASACPRLYMDGEKAVSGVATRKVFTGVPLSEQAAFYQEGGLLPTADFDLKKIYVIAE